MTLKTTTINQLLERYDLFLIDAYGVLMTSAGPLPGASELLKEITSRGKDYFILTNDASRTPETCVRVYRDRGLSVPLEKILSAGVAITETYRSEKLQGVKTVVLGTDDTAECVRRGGGLVQAITDDAEFDVLVIGDDSGFDLLPTMNALLTATHRLVKSRRSPRFLLANPDLLYPTGSGGYAFTSGSLARLFEIGLRDLHPHQTFNFEILGKPSPLLYDLARARVRTTKDRTLMLGDQLHTDIAGAHRAGIHSALLATGITQLPLANDLRPDFQPTYILTSL